MTFSFFKLIFLATSSLLMNTAYAQHLSCQVSTLFPGQSIFIGNQQIRCSGSSDGGGSQQQVTKFCGCEKTPLQYHNLILNLVHHSTGKITRVGLGSYEFRAECEKALGSHRSCR